MLRQKLTLWKVKLGSHEIRMCMLARWSLLLNMALQKMTELNNGDELAVQRKTGRQTRIQKFSPQPQDPKHKN